MSARPEKTARRLAWLLCLAGAVTCAWAAGAVGAQAERAWVWQNPLPQGNAIYAVRFAADKRTGWAVGADGVILHTADGGETWVQQPGAPRERPLFDVVVRGDTGFVIGDAGTVLRSRDAGVTWQLEPMPIQLAARWLRSVWLVDDTQGLAVGAEGLVFRLIGGRLERLAAAGDLR